MVVWAIDESNNGNGTGDIPPMTITVIEILPDVPTSTPSFSTSSRPHTLSSISLTMTTVTNSATNSLLSRISTPTSSTPTSSIPPLTSSTSHFPSTSSPPASSGTSLSQNTKTFSASSSSLHSGAIAGIVIACIFIFLVGTIFVIRIWSKRKRASKLRKTWLRSFTGIRHGIDAPEPSYETKFTPGNGNFRGQALSVQIPSPHVSVPPISYNNDVVYQHPTSPVTSSPPTFTSPVYLPGFVSLSPYSTTVVCAFIPSLPDELTVCIGETLRVLAGYEDGWSLCMDCRGKQGMVPNECLDKSFSSMGLIPPNDDFGVFRNSTRVTSLAQAVRHGR